ncbi:MAG: hypothetical protein RL516_147 [Bacteroidota bacterium]|jgi:hypothetical protein
MRKIFLLFLFVCAAINTKAQDTLVNKDTILLKNGEELICKITEVNPTYIICQLADSDSVSNRIIPKETIFILKYANGTRDVFSLESLVATYENADVMYNKGQADAKLYFRTSGVFWGSFGSTLIYPPFGLPTTAILASVKPNRENFRTSNPALLKNENYLKGYEKGAHKKKIAKSLTGFGTAVGVWVGLILVVVASFSAGN